jgi:hypothetical protein
MPAVWTPNAVFALAFTLTGLGLFGLRMGQRRYRPVFLLLAFAAVLVSVGCGGAVNGSNGAGTPSGTSTVTVAGTNSANGGTASTQLTLTVQ